jgi:hypothetical protein
MARTHNILTVLLLSATPAAAHTPLCDGDGYPLVGNVAFKGDPYHPSPPADAAVPAPLRALRVDLIRTGRDTALKDVSRFRPLCDQDGYPLVGNLASKGDMYQPSQFCSDVRKIEQHR